MSISFEIRASNFFLGSVLFLLSLGLYLPTLGFDFTYDDFIQIFDNDYVRSKNTSPAQLLSVFGKPTIPGDLYRPLASFSFRLNNLIADAAPWVFHLTNNLIYALTTVLVFLLARQFFRDKFAGFTAALIFMLQPVHVEPVANIYGRTELLAAFFGLVSLYFFIKAFEEKRLYKLMLAAALFFMALLSKESALTLLLLAPLFVYFSSETKLKELIKPSAVLVGVALLYLLLRYLTLKDSFLVKAPNELFFQENPLFHVAFWQRIWPSLYILGRYIQLMLLPGTLSADYSFPENDIQVKMSSAEGLFFAMIGILIPLIIYLLYRYQRKAACFWTLWILTAFSLTLNLIVPIGTFYAERLAFLPSVGAAVVAMLIFKFLFEQKSFRALGVFLFCGYLTFLCFKTINRQPVWNDNFTLFDSTYTDNPHSSKAAMIRGMIYFKDNRYEVAAESFKEAIFRDPGFTIPGKFLVITYFRLNDFGRAAYWAMKYLQVDPKDAEVQEVYRVLRSNSLGAEQNGSFIN